MPSINPRNEILANLITIAIWGFCLFGVVQSCLFILGASAWLPKANETYQFNSKDNELVFKLNANGSACMNVPLLMDEWKRAYKLKSKNLPLEQKNILATPQK